MPVRVLIVDDHARFRATVRRSLECEGWTVVGEAPDGRSGLDATRDLDPELVLLDIGLPDMSGLEVAGVARADQLVVEVRDDGHGGADPAGGGLRGLADRVAALDGCLTIRSSAGAGTVLRAEIPCAS